MSGTWDALKRAERDREQAENARANAAEQLAQDIAALRVAVHSLEDRVELGMGALQDEIGQAIAKTDALSASRGRAVEDRLLTHLGWLGQASQRGERRLNVVMAVAGVAALVSVFRC